MATETPTFPATMAPARPALGLSESTLSFPEPPTDLIESDGEPLESHWHVDEINLLCDVTHCHFRQRDDFYAAGNMFIYFNQQQARDRDYRGPDFFFVNGGVSKIPMRPYWAVWNEKGRYPDVIIELMSPTTKTEDLTSKKDIYERTFRTYEYFCYDPETRQLLGWRLGRVYKEIVPDERGWLWSEELGLWLGVWQGEYLGYDLLWLRFFDANGNPVPTYSEAAQTLAQIQQQRADFEQQRADAAQQQADEAKHRADEMAAELARLKAQLATKP